MLPISFLILAILILTIGGITTLRILFPNSKATHPTRQKLLPKNYS
jgi:hypothetical protein